VKADTPSPHTSNSYSLIFGVSTGIADLDPHRAWDTESSKVIDQVVENLFANDLSDPENTLVPRLASDFGTWSNNGLNYTVVLRAGVTFHDETPFNAAAVKWNFDRLNYFMNSESRPFFDSLYRWPDETFIINRTEIINTQTITFVLNRPFGAFESLLSFSGSGILSPTSTPLYNYIDTLTGDLVGTGPFVFDENIQDVEINFHAYENYWAGVANISALKFSIIQGSTNRTLALLSGEIDCLDSIDSSLLDILEANSNFTLESKQNAIIYFLGMNNKQINKTMRQAISYAINYSYIIDELLEGQAVRLKSPIPEGIMYANWSFNVAIMNVTKARLIMQSMGYGAGFTTDADWETATFATYNYSYNIGSPVRENMLPLLQLNLGKIGIKIVDAGMPWMEFLMRLYGLGEYSYDSLQLYMNGWGPDYNDPSNFINTFFSNSSSTNSAQVNDQYLQELIDQGLLENDPIQREAIYDEIQQSLVEDLMPHAFLYVSMNYVAYSNNITGFHVNSIGKVWLYNVQSDRSFTIPETPIELIFGTSSGISDLDPHRAWDSGSINVIDQVVETLFAYDLSDPDYSLIPRLAIDFGTWSGNGLNYTIDIRPDVTFHDGTQFNAAAVKWNFDRLAYFVNSEEERTPFDSLYRWPDGTPISNRTEVINTYTIRIVLNRPFGALESLLSFSGSGMLSSTSTPQYNYIDTFTGDLVGTGPFVYDEYQPDTEVNFHAYENYWAGVANFTDLKFSIIQDGYVRTQALLSGEIDILTDPITDLIETLEEDPNIIVESEQGTVIYYLGMNNNQINKTLRQAISYAIDYDYIIDDIMDGYAARMKSVVPEGILYANGSFNVATMNITKARTILVDAGICNFDIYNDLEWQDATINNPIAMYNYTYNLGNFNRENLGILVKNNLRQIGINVELTGVTWSEYISRLLNYGEDSHDKLQLFQIGWGEDYNDPSNFINPLFSNSSSANAAQVNDPYLQNLITQGLAETDPIEREAIYDEIQQYLIEDLMPWAYLYVGMSYVAYNDIIANYPFNPMGDVWLYDVSFKAEPFTIFIDGDATGAGDHNWMWAENQAWCSGSGTWNDPYIIENLMINANSNTGIEIRNSDVYFIIKNCTILNSNSDYPDAGIYLNNVRNGFILNNNCSHNFSGIYLEFSSNITISGNIVNYNEYSGIRLESSDTNTILENNVDFNSNSGIVLHGSNNNNISKNTAHYNLFFGIELSGENIILSENSMINCGLYLLPDSEGKIHSYDIDTSNVVNEKPIIYYENELNLESSDFMNAGQIILINCSNSIIANIKMSNVSLGIYLVESNNIIISNNSITNTIASIQIAFSSNINITQNTLKEHRFYGIAIMNCNESLISENVIDKSQYGVFLVYSGNNSFVENRIQKSSMAGINIIASQDNLIYNNFFIDNVLNAVDDGIQNSWNQTDIGNYWDDYNGTDINDDGIGDIPYNITGSANSFDYYPRMYFVLNTSVGTNVEVSDPITEISLTFDEVSEDGNTLITISEAEPEPDSGFAVAGNYFDINSTSTYTGTITLSIPYDEDMIVGEESDLKLMHFNSSSGMWEDITTYVDIVDNVIYGETTNFSIFLIIQPDITPPTTTIDVNGIQGSNGWFITDVIVSLDAIDDLTGIDKIEYSFNDIDWDDYTASLSISTEGTTIIYYRAIDNAGNIEATSSTVIQIDKTTPDTTIDFIGTMGFEGWYTTNVDILLSALDEFSDIDKIQYSFDSDNWYTYIGPIPVQIQGTTFIYYRAIDNAGNIEATSSTVIQIDKTAPDTTNDPIGEMGFEGWYTSDVDILLSATDDLSGVSKIEYSLNDFNWYDYLGSILISTEGTTTIYYRAIDNAGNVEATSSIVIQIDKTAPDTTIDPIGEMGFEGWYTSDVDILLSAMDDLSGVNNIEYSLNDIDWYYYLGSIPISTEGPTTIYYRAIDNAGNIEATSSIVIQIDKTTPETELIISTCASDESDNIYVINESNFILVAADNYSGVFQTYYRINGSIWIEFNGAFNLTGFLGIYIIDYYSIDIAGNIEAINSTTVILVDEFGETFQGFGIIRVKGDKFIGAATMTITEETILLEVEDQEFTWDIVGYSEFGTIEIYHGEGDLGGIRVIVIRCGSSTIVIAIGRGVFFVGYS